MSHCHISCNWTLTIIDCIQPGHTKKIMTRSYMRTISTKCIFNAKTKQLWHIFSPLGNIKKLLWVIIIQAFTPILFAIKWSEYQSTQETVIQTGLLSFSLMKCQSTSVIMLKSQSMWNPVCICLVGATLIVKPIKMFCLGTNTQYDIWRSFTHYLGLLLWM